MAVDLAAEFESRGPWFTRFVIDGRPFGGDYDALNDDRLEQFQAAFPDVTTILELGSFEGGHTAKLASLPKVTKVVGLEGRIENVERANFVLSVLGHTNAEVHVADLETCELQPFGNFDVVFNVGLLYHLPRPWELLERIAGVTDRMYLSTHYCADFEVDAESNGVPGRWYQEFGYEDPLSGLASSSFWPTRAALLQMLENVGFGHFDISFDQVDFPHGPLICLSTRK